MVILKMSLISRTILTLVLCLTVLASGATGLAGGMVLCVGADGCVAVEVAHTTHVCHCEISDRSCESEPESADPAGQDHALSAAETGDDQCSDSSVAVPVFGRKIPTPDLKLMEPVALQWGGLMDAGGAKFAVGSVENLPANSFGGAGGLDLMRLASVILVI